MVFNKQLLNLEEKEVKKEDVNLSVRYIKIRFPMINS
jgi:hypothetical protein